MSRLPRVAAIHDLSGVGRCALTIILPVMSAMGIQVCPMPTAVLSSHMGFKKPAVQELTDFMQQSAAHWKKMELHFDAIYSGFLASERQLALVSDLIAEFGAHCAQVLVDPVMADGGKRYRGFDERFTKRMSALTDCASLITPNITEAALLLETDYDSRPQQAAGYENWVRRLSAEGRRSVVLTGVQASAEHTGAMIYDRKSDRVRLVSAPLVPQSYPGTGDLFASVLLGRLLQGAELQQAAQSAVDFVSDCTALTLREGSDFLHGVQFERLLYRLCE